MATSEKKRIVIIGGGISGLVTLHYLNRKYSGRDDVELCLFEKETTTGGTIHTIVKDGCYFETGPNGFLNSKPQTLELIKELGLSDSVIQANEQAKIRYISVSNTLYKLPENLKDFLTFKLLSFWNKARVLCEFFVPKGFDSRESVYAFGKRRLGERFAQLFLDPMVSGIYGGDARAINLKAAFPRMHELEKTYGSLFLAMFNLQRKRKKNASPQGTLTSFKEGMQILTDTLSNRYKDQIVLNSEISHIENERQRFELRVNGNIIVADHLIISAPAFAASTLVKNISSKLSEMLQKIPYAPMAVVGLKFSKDDFKQKPQGFGYLIPSEENKEVLGVLFDSNIFENRSTGDDVLLRVMIGGSRNPKVISYNETELIELAVKEIQAAFQMKALPQKTFVTKYNKAIPQYDNTYVECLPVIEQELKKFSGLKLTANYIKGVALNDCVENAYRLAETITIKSESLDEVHV